MAYSSNIFHSGSGAEASDSYADIPQNRTLIAERLSQAVSHVPEVVHGLETIERVFEHYRPYVDALLETPDGVVQKETLVFNSLEDFGLQRLKEKSWFLKKEDRLRVEYLKILKEVNSNKTLQTLIAQPGVKQSLLTAIKCLRAELKQNH